ncbi:MAG TPA: helix-turn-helix domain-containing protein, partial [Candidatus Dormibacteraeota bacterium]|nr:helix-turn-helix domain-containing protein [Candidatus Dormibacteraeota bacterium]
MTERELHKLGEVLRIAREAKGVDLARVERDTKIRVRYLSALENGEYRDLPGSVYTKGFLRNYAAYLGLDAEYLIDLYRLESAGAKPERLTVPTPPRPIATRRSRGFVLTPGAVVAALLTVGVGLFIYYIGSELVTFARIPALTITDPVSDVAGYQGTAYTIRGITEPNSRVTVDGLRENPNVIADPSGAFTIRVRLLPGKNVITLVALDPVTGRLSPEVSRTIEVGGDGPSPSPPSVLALTSPEEGATLSGPVALAGTATSGAVVAVTAAFVSAPPATMRVVTLAGQDVPIPSGAPGAPAPLELTTGADGTFEGSLTLAAGTWDVTFTPGETAADAVTRRLTIGVPPGLGGTITISGGPSYLEVDEDGTPKAGVSGRNSPSGTVVQLAAQTTLRVRVGNAGAVRL